MPDHELLRVIGRGAYGEVWLGRNILGEYRAVKVVWRREFAGEDRPFEREFEGIRKFEPVSRSHPSQLAILHVGKNDELGYFYYVMELADEASAECGSRHQDLNHVAPAASQQPRPLNPDSYVPKTLRRVLRERGALPAQECLEISLALAGALAHLHAQGLVHRGIKPSNVVFVGGVPKLADIGLVAAVDDTLSFVGTPGYIPPEGPGTPKADVFSLGKVIYEALTGRDRQEFPALPQEFAGPTRDSGSKAQEEGMVRTKERALIVELNQVILRACESDCRLRYRSAQAMHEELALLKVGVSVKRKRAVERLWATGKKLAIIGILPLVSVTLSTLLLRQFTRSDVPGEGPPSTNLLANALSEKAFLIIRGDDEARCSEAYSNFVAAIALDPRFARPYAGLFELGFREWAPSARQVGQKETRRIAFKLEELGPKLAATHFARAVVSYGDLDFPRASELIRKAIAVKPNYEPAHTTYGFMLMSWGWPVKAREQLKKSMETAASKVTIYATMGHTYRLERDYTNAIAWYKKALSLEPQYTWAYGGLAETYEAMGDYTNSIENFYQEELQATQDKARLRRFCDDLQRAFKEGGKRGYYQRLEKAETEFYDQACIQIRLGNKEIALDLLRKAVQAVRNGSPEGNLHWLLVHECWDSVREDPRFKEILDKATFSKVMPRGGERKSHLP